MISKARRRPSKERSPHCGRSEAQRCLRHAKSNARRLPPAHANGPSARKGNGELRKRSGSDGLPNAPRMQPKVEAVEPVPRKRSAPEVRRPVRSQAVAAAEKQRRPGSPKAKLVLQEAGWRLGILSGLLTTRGSSAPPRCSLRASSSWSCGSSGPSAVRDPA